MWSFIICHLLQYDYSTFHCEISHTCRLNPRALPLILGTNYEHLSWFICVYCCEATVKTNAILLLFVVFKISIDFLVITIYKSNKSFRLDIDSPIIWECVIRNNEMILKEVFVSVSTKTCKSYCYHTCIIFPFLWW